MYSLYFYILININNVLGHTWVDSISCSCPNTIGYTRNYLSREDIEDFDRYNTYGIYDTNGDTPICSILQSENFNFKEFPKLRCAPGSDITLTYNPNGHISKDICIDNDPRECRGSISPMTYIYIASNKNIYPEELKTRSDVNTNTGLNINTDYDTKLSNIVKYRIPYDSYGTCKEDSEPCKITFQLPTDLLNHTDYQFIFYHIFNRNPFSEDIEEYTSCFTIHSHEFSECKKNNKCN